MSAIQPCDRPNPPNLSEDAECRLVFALMMVWGLEQLLHAFIAIPFPFTATRLFWWWLIQLVNGIWLFRFGVTGMVRKASGSQAQALSLWTAIWWCSGLMAAWMNWQVAPPILTYRQIVVLHGLEITGLFLAVLTATRWLTQPNRPAVPAVWLAAFSHIEWVALAPQQLSTLTMAVRNGMPAPLAIWPTLLAGSMLVAAVILLAMRKSHTACWIAALALIAGLISGLLLDIPQIFAGSGTSGLIAPILHLIYTGAQISLLIVMLWQAQRNH